MRNVSARSNAGVIAPDIVIAASASAVATIAVWVVSSSFLRSTTSASAPAGIDRSRTGSVVATWTIATHSGEGTSDVISHDAPTSCIHVPMLETTVAIQSQRKSVWPSGVQRVGAEGVSASTGAGSLSPGGIKPNGWPWPCGRQARAYSLPFRTSAGRQWRATRQRLYEQTPLETDGARL